MNSQNIKEKLMQEKVAKEKKIEQCQKRIKEIDAKLIELDNSEIIGIVRTLNLTPQQLTALLNKESEKGDIKNE